MAADLGPIVSEHKDRTVREEGDFFVKEFASLRACAAELEKMLRLEEAGVRGPKVVAVSGSRYVTERLPGMPLDELIRARWRGMPRGDRNALIARVAAVCARIRDAGLDWPDLVTYHIFVSEKDIRVLDPARLARGKLDLSPLFWSAEEPTVSRADRLRFWRAYAGDAPPPRIRRIGHRGRFRPYRWALQRTAIRPCPPFGPFVNAVGAPYASAEEVAQKAQVVRRLEDRTNARLGDLVVKITTDPEEARAEWENHRLMMAAGFRVPEPAVGGLLADGRGLFSSVPLLGLEPLDEIWKTLDPRRAALAVADLARRLHACGLVHRDLYLCHLFARPGDYDLTLIDLARLRRSTSRRRRVKDLAALLSSATGLVSRTCLWRGLLRYGGDRKLARRVVRKAARIARHVPRNVRDGTHVLKAR
ncbi:MAG TPA: lipopolysaccharide kinase InaA family protein [Planctomycetota bacterium]|nr:lipopolysaccharide kinase InaA family protein [Planctomycetota bacterium]